MSFPKHRAPSPLGLARILFVCAALLGFAGAVTAPAFAAGGQAGNVSGTVLDSQSKAPISGATVTFASGSGTYSVKTAANGFFSALGLPVDTYVMSVAARGYESQSQAGITVPGDQTLNLGTIALARQLRTIGRVTARSANSAFQPKQTIDSYTISGQRMVQTQGKAVATNENSLLLAVPGVTTANSGDVVIRGGGSREIGYQYDGVSFVEPFLSINGAAALGGGGLVNGVGSVQVVEGAGDATQGNVGSGVVNLIPKRGTYPGTGLIDAEMGGPNYSHQLGFEYGFATPNGRVSDYVSFVGQRFVPYFGYPTTDVAAYLNYFGDSYRTADQFTNNFVYKFGKNNAQSLQVLYTNISQTAYGNVGGIPPGTFPSNPNALVYYPYDTLSQSTWMGLVGAFGMSPAQYAKYIGLGPGVPTTNVAITTPQQNAAIQTRFLKFEYDNSLSENTFLALRYYNWEQLNYSDNQYSLGPASGGISVWNSVGGPTTGGSLDLTQQLGTKLTVNFEAKYDALHPIWEAYEPQLQAYALFLSGIGADNPNGVTGPSPADWLPGGYLSKYFGNNIPRIPAWGINYNGTLFQNWGSGIRFQYNPINPLKFDIGVRYEGQDQHWFGQMAQYGQNPPPSVISPYDVLPSFWQPSVLQPREWEPRAAVSYQANADNAFRFSYGRSAVFGNAQSTGTPFQVYNVAQFMKIPPIAGFQCGIPSVKLFPCQSYGEQLYWIGDQVEAPDAGNGRPATYNNYDMSWLHQFRSGWGLRLTPFFKEGTNLPTFGLVAILPGGGAIFAPSNFGFNKTTGIEASITTPEQALGFSGFLSATYQNVLGTTPPLTVNETNVPLVEPATLELGDLYRAGYVSPFSVRIGGTYNMKNGFSINPTLQYNIGYPYSLGNLIAAQLASGVYANVPQVDFGPGVTTLTGVGNAGGTAASTNYYDPSYSGNSLHPNIAATRGTPATAANGGFLSHSNLVSNMTFEYRKNANTFGVQFLNFFGNAYVNTVPAVNPFYQPVANGLSGPQTNFNSCASATGGNWGTARGCTKWIPSNANAFVNGAYLLSDGDFTGSPLLAPLRPMTFQVYYQRKL